MKKLLSLSLFSLLVFQGLAACGPEEIEIAPPAPSFAQFANRMKKYLPGLGKIGAGLYMQVKVLKNARLGGFDVPGTDKNVAIYRSGNTLSALISNQGAPITNADITNPANPSMPIHPMTGRFAAILGRLPGFAPTYLIYSGAKDMYNAYHSVG